MIRTFLASLLITVATPAFAADAPAEQQFTRDGVTYTYTTRVDGDVTIIEGRNVSTDEAFTLKVRNDWVDGDYNGKRVTFIVPSKSGGSALAAR